MSDYMSLLQQMKADDSIRSNNLHEKLFATCVHLLEIYFSNESVISKISVGEDIDAIKNELNLMKKMNQKLAQENKIYIGSNEK